MSHYYEAHITVEPVFGERLEHFKEICAKQDFHVADLYMLKRKEDTPERSRYDTFCTGRDTDFTNLQNRMAILRVLLDRHAFKIWRYKIESTIIDVRVN